VRYLGAATFLISRNSYTQEQKISKLETENKQLQKDLDALEQYGRRSLIRISGLSDMDIFCDNSGCTNSIASAISLLFEELVSESDRESKGSDLT
jgi:hypothetical protein